MVPREFAERNQLNIGRSQYSISGDAQALLLKAGERLAVEGV
jgi:hypothetical protein